MTLDEKYFRRVDKFDGDRSKFRGWLFDLIEAINQINPELGGRFGLYSILKERKDSTQKNGTPSYQTLKPF